MLFNFSGMVVASLDDALQSYGTIVNQQCLRVVQSIFSEPYSGGRVRDAIKMFIRA